MDMYKELKSPPIHKNDLTPSRDLCAMLESLIGQEFILTGKTKTDGSNIRKLIGNTLYETNDTPDPASISTYEIIPPRKKGVPKILLEYIDSYIITSGINSYNLQVWNRNPASESVQIEYYNGEVLSANEVRFVFTKISLENNCIESIIILTPNYIVENFGKFGKPTVKHQLIISNLKRNKIISSPVPILFYPDDAMIYPYLSDTLPSESTSIHDYPTDNQVLSLEHIYNVVKNELIGIKLDAMPTKNRGQALELIVANLLGYSPNSEELLAGGYPDIRNQMLEVKVQDSPTVDLGKYSPEFEEVIYNGIYKTTTIRYLIALTNPSTGIIEGVVLCPGNKLGENFTYISDTSYKVQRNIPMSFFDKFSGSVVYNPSI